MGAISACTDHAGRELSAPLAGGELMVKTGMLAMRQEGKVFDSIIECIVIEMMDMFRSEQ